MNYHFIIDKCNSRSFYLYDILKDAGYTVSDYNDNISLTKGYKPVYLFSPQKKITATDSKKLLSNSIVFAGKVENQESLIAKKIRSIPLLKDELYVHYNSIITAEGAISLALSKTETALYDSFVLILGYGRLGKATSQMIKGLAKSVSIATYDKGEYNAAAAHYLAYYERNYIENMSAYNIIINTIPYEIIGKDDIRFISEDTLFIDLASTSCISNSGAKNANFLYFPALGLPDKIAPYTAAKELYKSILRELKRLEKLSEGEE